MSNQPTLQDLFPQVTEEQLAQIAEVLHSYGEVVWRVYERLERENPAIIDELVRNSSMRVKVEDQNQN